MRNVLIAVGRGCMFWIALATPPASAWQSQKNDQSSWLQFGADTNWRTAIEVEPESRMSIAWEREIGTARSQVVGTGSEIYVTSGLSDKEGDRTRLTTRIVALQLGNGEEKWKQEFTSAWLDEQETFGGAPASPQATPTIAGPFLISLSFTGQLTCFDRTDGKLMWNIDLVKDLGATPVQFGFSASPVIDPSQPERVYVLAAGKSAGFYCLNVQDGSIVWKSECETCSYATPVSGKFGGMDQWVIVTADEVLGIDKSNGRRLWRYALPETELTNVPTPMVIDETRLMISGQGCKGTRCLMISEVTGNWTVREKWYSRQLTFFYTNWVRFSDRVVVGCTDQYLAALDLDDGTTLGRWRGYSDGNVAMVGQRMLVIEGNGNLSLLEPIESSGEKVEGFTVLQKRKVMDARCWTPLSVVGNRILIRGDDRLVCLAMDQGNSGGSLANLLASAKPLEFQTKLTVEEVADPVEQVFAIFESRGQAAAMEQYAQLRKDQRLDESARVALAEAAHEQGLVDVARLIMTHAKEDFPGSPEIESVARSILGN